MAAAEHLLTSPRAPEVVTSPLVERIRRGIIGEGELMDGPFGPRGPPASVRDLPGCHPTSRRCAGSRCPPPACWVTARIRNAPPRYTSRGMTAAPGMAARTWND